MAETAKKAKKKKAPVDKAEKAEKARVPFEFDEKANATFSGLGGAMKVVALLQIVGSVFLGAFAAMELKAGRPGTAGMFAVQAVLNGLVSYWLTNAAKSFQSVADTSGSDIPHLMSALGELRKMFTLHRALIVGCLVFFVAGAVTVTLAGQRTAVDPTSPEFQGGQY